VRLPTLKPAPPEILALAGLWTGLVDLALAGLVVLVMADAWAPPQDLAWKPLKLDQPLGMATKLKFARAAKDPALCRKVLTEGGVEYREAETRRDGFCGTANSLRLEAGVTPLSPVGPVTTCPLALGYAFWSRHVLQPAARDTLGSPVVQVEHYGTYACRNVYGRTEGRPSEHALANASIARRRLPVVPRGAEPRL